MPALILFQYLLLNPVKNLGLQYPLKRISGSCLQECCLWKPLPVVVDTWDSLGFRNLSFSGPKCPEAFIGVFLHILGLALVLSGLPLPTTAESCTERASRALLGGGVQCSTGSSAVLGRSVCTKGAIASASPSNSAFKPKHLQLLPAQLRDEQHGRHPQDTILHGARQWSLNPQINFKPRINLWEHNKFVTEVIMKLWSADAFGHAGFEEVFSLGHSSGGVLQKVWGALVWQMITDKQRCWVRAAAGCAGGSAEVTAWLPWPLVSAPFCNLWLASVLVNICCVQKPFPCKWLWACLGCSGCCWTVLLASHWEHFCALWTLLVGMGAHICVRH